MNRFEAYAAEPRDYIEADEERARGSQAHALRIARHSDDPDAIAHDPDARAAYEREQWHNPAARAVAGRAAAHRLFRPVPRA